MMIINPDELAQLFSGNFNGELILRMTYRAQIRENLLVYTLFTLMALRFLIQSFLVDNIIK